MGFAAAQPVFCLLGFIDVDRQAIPLDNASLPVVQRLTTSMVPTKLAVRSTDAVHSLVRSSGLNCAMESPYSFWKVIVVQEGLPTAMLEVLQGHASVIQHGLIELGRVASGVR